MCIARRNEPLCQGIFFQREEPAINDIPQRSLRRIRREAGSARQHDVYRAILAETAAKLPEALKAPAELLMSKLTAERWAVQRAVVRLADDHGRLGRRSRIGKLVRCRGMAERQSETADTSTSPAYTLAALAAAALPELLAAVQRNYGGELKEADQLHGLRIAGKKLRYALEVFAGCFPPRMKETRGTG